VQSRRLAPVAWPVPLGSKVMLVDHAVFANPLGERLRAAGLEVLVRFRGSDALVTFGSDSPDVVVIAPTLPDVPATEVVLALRRSGSQPVLVGVGPGDAEVVGPVLLAGATAAVARPYDVDEVLQHASGALRQRSADRRLAFGPLVLDPVAHTVHQAGVELDRVPLKEFALLRLLMANGDRVVTNDRIRSSLWLEVPPSRNALAVHVARLRRRLQEPVTVRTVRGLGYRLTLAKRQDLQGSP
jgi:DNA-binding response OmpR family regulator